MFPFRPKRPDSKALKPKIIAWAEQQMAQGVHRQAVCDCLLEQALDTECFWDAWMNGSRKKSAKILEREKAIDEVRRELCSVMDERNRQAGEYERAGRVDQAIKLYEANVADGFSGTQPYRRLYKLYAKRKNFADAARVCYAAFNNVGQPEMIELFQDCLDRLELMILPEQLEELRLRYEKPTGGEQATFTI